MQLKQAILQLYNRCVYTSHYMSKMFIAMYTVSPVLLMMLHIKS